MSVKLSAVGHEPHGTRPNVLSASRLLCVLNLGPEDAGPESPGPSSSWFSAPGGSASCCVHALNVSSVSSSPSTLPPPQARLASGPLVTKSFHSYLLLQCTDFLPSPLHPSLPPCLSLSLPPERTKPDPACAHTVLCDPLGHILRPRLPHPLVLMGDLL